MTDERQLPESRIDAGPTVPDSATAPSPGHAGVVLPESRVYRAKRFLLGKPLVSERLHDQKLSRFLASGVLAPDCISSSAYGSEEMLRVLVPAVGAAAFSLVIPVTIAILVILAVVTLSYREVVSVYTRIGGCYVVTRDNFGHHMAQVAASALIVDYILTVAVQIAAGADALGSAFHVFRPTPVKLTVCVVVLALMCFGNLRGIREAGSAFALPTYFYIVSLGFVVVVGMVRGILGQLHSHLDVHHLPAGHVAFGSPGSGFLLGASMFIMLRALANGGASLTGLEAVSDGVPAFKAPVAKNARFVLGFISISLGSLVLGVSLIAHWTHPVPYASGSPTVVSQIVTNVLGSGGFGRAVFYIVQFATMIVLFTGGNTSFNGFPYLASFVAEDSFLPRWFLRRGHRLVFSNGILVLTGAALALLLATRGSLDSLIALYAIGVFTGFTLTGAALSKYHALHKERGWKRRLVVNSSAAVVSGVIVVIFAVTKFTQGAFVVVVLMPVIVFFLIRLHRQYEIEGEELEEGAPRVSEVPALRRHSVAVMIGDLDLATLRALRYARTLGPDEMHAVHFVIDAQKAAALVAEWQHYSLSRIPLEMVECPDRRLVRSALEYCAHLAADGETQVTVLLPRRFYERLWSRLLHDRTADSIAEGVARLPHVNATIIPFHLGSQALVTRGSRRARKEAEETPGPRREVRAQVRAPGPVSAAAPGSGAADGGMAAAPGSGVPETAGTAAGAAASVGAASSVGASVGAASSVGASVGAAASVGASVGAPPPSAPPPPRQHALPGEVPLSALPAPMASEFDDLAAPVPGARPIGEVQYRQMVTVAGRVRSVQIQPYSGIPNLECLLVDETGSLPLVFVGRREVAGVGPGAKLVARGRVCEHHGRLSILNPEYEFLAATPASASARTP